MIASIINTDKVPERGSFNQDPARIFERAEREACRRLAKIGGCMLRDEKLVAMRKLRGIITTASVR